MPDACLCRAGRPFTPIPGFCHSSKKLLPCILEQDGHSQSFRLRRNKNDSTTPLHVAFHQLVNYTNDLAAARKRGLQRVAIKSLSWWLWAKPSWRKLSATGRRVRAIR